MMPIPSLRRCLCLHAVVALAFLAFPAAARSDRRAGDVDVSQHSLDSSKGERIEYEVGTLYVPENRNDKESRLIGVGFARFVSKAKPPKSPPIFRLPGGPGGSYVSRLKPLGRRQRNWLQAELDRYLDVGDVVFVDQRGFSERGDKLEATFQLPPRNPRQPRSLESNVEAFRVFARQAVAQYAATDIDLRGYNVKECAHDVADLCHALGYNKISLCGTSFGSQWSFAIMRLHPDLVERALLSGVEPLNYGYDMPSHVFAAVRRMWRTIDQDARFKDYLPDGGMAEAARVVIERLEREQITLHANRDEDAATKVIGTFGPNDFPWSDPARILELYHGRKQFLTLTLLAEGTMGRRNIPLIGPLIDSSLGVTPEREFQLRTDPATRYLGRGNFALYLATADIWPSPDVGDEFRTPILCDIPVVFAQGDWDVQTPVENTYQIAPYFLNSRVIVGERGGHGILETISHASPDAWDELRDFLRNGDMTDIPARVILPPSRRFSPPRFSLERGKKRD